MVRCCMFSFVLVYCQKSGKVNFSYLFLYWEIWNRKNIASVMLFSFFKKKKELRQFMKCQTKRSGL